MSALDLFLYVMLPYLAVGQLVPAFFFRLQARGPLLYVIDSEELRTERDAWFTRCGWIGAAILILLHVLPFLGPGHWGALIAAPSRLVVVELIGFTGASLFLLGMIAFLRRRLADPKLSPLRSGLELAALGSVIAAAVAGAATAVTARWGTAWYAAVVGPYLWSLARLHPDVSALSALGFWPRAHLATAFLAMALVPFTTLPRQLAAPLISRAKPSAAEGGAR